MEGLPVLFSRCFFLFLFFLSPDVSCSAHKHSSAVLSCTKCAEQYETVANYLTEPIDVFAEWLDEIAAANEPQNQVDAAAAGQEEDEGW